MKRKAHVKNQNGFTIIEIIAVLILMGLLAAAAVPRYVSIVEAVKNSSALVAVGEAKARINQAAAAYILLHAGTTPAATDFVASDFGTSAGDFTIAYDVTGTTSVGITATGAGPAAGGTATGTTVLPTT